MKKLLLFLFCIITTGVCTAQNERYFDYDASWNRVLRTIVFPMMTDRSMPSSEESNPEQSSEFADKIGEIFYKAFPNPTMGELTI